MQIINEAGEGQDRTIKVGCTWCRHTFVAGNLPIKSWLGCPKCGCEARVWEIESNWEHSRSKRGAGDRREWFRVTLGKAVFGIARLRGIIVETAPIATYARGKDFGWFARSIEKRGGRLELLESAAPVLATMEAA